MNELQTSAAFYIAAVLAVIATQRAITHVQAVRALLYLIVSFLAVAVIFFLLGAPFAAALEVITYAGAIMVLFVFVVMMLNLGPASAKQEKDWLRPGIFTGPGILTALLLAEWIYVVVVQVAPGTQSGPGAHQMISPVVSPVISPIISIDPAVVGEALLTRYLIGVELASMLLLAGLVGAYHIGYRKRMEEAKEVEEEGGRVASREVA